jgi:hypothetical protein
MINAPTIHSLSRSRFLVLLIALVLLMLITPFLRESQLHEAFLGVLLGLIMLGGVLAAKRGRTRWVIALALGIPWLFISMSSLIWQAGPPSAFGNLMFIVYAVYTFSTVLGSVVSAPKVDFDVLLGAVAGYLLIAIIWAVSFLVIHETAPGSFSNIATEQQAHFHEFLYLSLTTLTTLGYGDITPLSPFARIWANLEAVVGTLYIALLVARLVSMYQKPHPK